MTTNKDFFRNKLHPLFESIETSSLKILKMSIKNNQHFNPFKFVNYCLKHNYHVGAVDESLKSAIKSYELINFIWPYCLAIVRAKTPTYRERQHIDKHIKVMDEFKSFVESSERVKEITKNIGNIWI